jgi:hypothetical protein
MYIEESEEVEKDDGVCVKMVGCKGREIGVSWKTPDSTWFDVKAEEKKDETMVYYVKMMQAKKLRKEDGTEHWTALQGKAKQMAEMEKDMSELPMDL